MDNATDRMKRPVIFVCHLSKQQLLKLAKNSYDFIDKYAGEYPTDMQVFIHRDATVNLVFSYSIDREEEVLCTDYNDFIAKWEQYKLWLILQNTQ